MRHKLGTLAVHAGEDQTWAVPSVTTPVFQTTTYRFPDAAGRTASLAAWGQSGCWPPRWHSSPVLRSLATSSAAC